MSTNLNTCRSPNYLSVAFICAVTVGTDYSLLKPFVSANHMLLESCEESWCTKSILGTDPALGDSRRYFLRKTTGNIIQSVYCMVNDIYLSLV